MPIEITIKLTLDGDRAECHEAVKTVLDNGDLQDAIVELTDGGDGGEVRVLSAEVLDVKDIEAERKARATYDWKCRGCGFDKAVCICP